MREIAALTCITLDGVMQRGCGCRSKMSPVALPPAARSTVRGQDPSTGSGRTISPDAREVQNQKRTPTT